MQVAKNNTEDHYNYKGNQFVQIPFPANGQAIISLNSPVYIDKIRITCFDSLAMTSFNTLKSVWCSLTDSIIGAIGTEYVPETVYNFMSQMAPKNGITFYYNGKVNICGTYKLRFSDVYGNVPAGVTDDVYILVEYFAKE